MKTIHLTVTFTGRVDDSFAVAMEQAWHQSAVETNVPIREVFLTIQGDKQTKVGFDFCQPVSLQVETPI